LKKLTAFLQKRFAIILVILFLLTLVPMLAISVYDFPMSDDYHYSLMVHNAIINGGSVWAVLQAAGNTVATAYQKWQGTYSSIFVMSMQPGVFSDWAYSLVPFILLGLLIFATFKLLHTILCACLHEKLRSVALIGVPILFLSIQYLPSANQGFYWFNGSSYYTLFYSVMLLYIDAFILFVRSERKSRTTGRFILAALLAAVLGGVNFVTALLTLLAGFIFIAYCFFKKRDKLLSSLVIQAIMLAGFLINVLAPGNAVRQATTKGMSVPLAILFSFRQAGMDIYLWVAGVVTVFILLIPLLYRIAGRRSFGFRYPGLFLSFTFLLFAAQNAPPFYAMGSEGQGRLVNIVYYAYIWFVLLNLFYFLGWAAKKHSQLAEGWRAFKRRLGMKEGSKAVACFAVALFLLAALNPSVLNKSSSWLCTYNLLSGDARSYGQQMQARLALYEDSSVLKVVVPPLTVAPNPLHFYEDITGDPTTYNNHTIAKYFHKTSVTVVDEK
jgi:hypothetical protein